MGDMKTVVRTAVLSLILSSAFLIACGPSVGRATGLTEPQPPATQKLPNPEIASSINLTSVPENEISSRLNKEITDGIWLLGTDIEPGTYMSENHNNSCDWARLKGFSGDIDDIISNDNPIGRTIVTITPSDAGFSSQGCGTWVFIEPYATFEPLVPVTSPIAVPAATLTPTPEIAGASVPHSPMRIQPTQTMISTRTKVPAPTATMNPTKTRVVVLTQTSTPIQTATPAPTLTPTPTPTFTLTPTPTLTPTRHQPPPPPATTR